MKKTLILLLVLVLSCSTVLGQTFYVDPAVADDTGTGLSPATALKTIAHAIIYANAHADASSTIKLIAGTYDNTVGSQGANFRISFTGAKDITIEPNNAPPATITISGDGFNGAGSDGFYHLLEFNSATANAITLNRLNFVSNNAAVATQMMRRVANDAQTVVYNNCSFNSSLGTYAYQMLWSAGTTKPNTTFNTCTFTTGTTQSLINPNKTGTITFSNCSGTIGYSVIFLADAAVDIDGIICDGSTLTMSGGTAVSGYGFFFGEAQNNSNTFAFSQMIVRNSTLSTANGFNGCITGHRQADYTLIDGSTITTSQSQIANNLLQFGYSIATTAQCPVWATGQNCAVGVIRSSDGEVYQCVTAINPTAAADKPAPNATAGANWKTYWTPMVHGLVRINNCTIGHNNPTNPPRAHVIHLGLTCEPGSSVTNCRVYGGDYGIVAKCGGALIMGNTVFVPANISLGGGIMTVGRHNSNIINNTVYALNQSAFYAGQQTSNSEDVNVNTSEGSLVLNNIFWCNSDGGAGDYAMNIQKTAYNKMYSNYNCLFTGIGNANGASLVSWTATDKTNLADAQSYWSTTFNYKNEANSISVNPQFVDAANDDFRLLSSSPCISTGTPTVGGGTTTIGAWQPSGYNGGDCQFALAGDLNGDCVVDLSDFAILASHWLQRSYVIIANFALNANPNWTTQGQWQFGTPMGMGGLLHGYPDPNAAYTGQNVYGVNLNGDWTVAVGGPYALTTGPFDCSSYATVELSFARWLNTDTADYVQCKVEASNDGSTWQTVWLNPISVPITDNQWLVVQYDISQIAAGHSQVYVRWSYQILSDRAYPYSGWNIDDVELQGLPN